MSTDTLFEQHSIQEIQDIEKKLRNDIERKKEELRQMVGERYRDLMEAADAITEMKNTAEKVMMCVESMKTNCGVLEQCSLKSGIINAVKLKVAQRKKKNENLYVVAALIKILMDSPAKIWSFIEVGDYLNAFLLYVLTRHTHSLLVLDPIYCKQGILTHFPVINKQWTSIRHFQSTLLQKSREELFTETICAEKIIGPLCCILFLSDTSVEQTLDEVFLSRKVATINIFRAEKSAKSQVSELVDVLQNTLESIHAVFHSCTSFNKDYKSNLLKEAVYSVTSSKTEGPIGLLDASSSIFSYLPEEVTSYRPSLKTKFENLNDNYLQEMCNKWIGGIKTELQEKLTDLLNYVSSIKGLALIKESIVGKLQQGDGFESVCRHLFGHTFSVWDFFLQEPFMNRIKDIINNQISTAIMNCQESLCGVYSEMDKTNLEESVSDYVWSESESDLAPNIGWITHHQRQLWEGGTLGMKAFALTPKIQSICFDLDQKLDSLLEDASYCNPEEKPAEEYWLKKKEQDISDPYFNVDAIYFCLTNECYTRFTSLGEEFKKNLDYYEECSGSNIISMFSRIVFLGHLTQGLTKLCPHLVECLNQRSNDQMGSKQLSASVIKDEPLWQQLKAQFLNLSDHSFRIWSKYKIIELIRKFDEEFSLCSTTGILKALLQWDKIEIQEESEDGNSVKSILRIPQQVSVLLYKNLFAFCWESNKIGAYSLNSQVRYEIQENYFHKLLKIYEKKIDEECVKDVFTPHLFQTQSLQCFFDVHFLLGFMGSKTNSESTELSKSIITKIVHRIDPFDMDVFTIHIQTNLKRALQRSVLLLGLATSAEQTNHLSSLKTLPTSAQVDHSLMLMPTTCPRLPLLPFANRSTALKTLSSSIQDPAASISQTSPLKSSRSHSSSPNLNTSDSMSESMLKSLSFYDRVTAMSSSWFGNT